MLLCIESLRSQEHKLTQYQDSVLHQAAPSLVWSLARRLFHRHLIGAAGAPPLALGQPPAAAVRRLELKGRRPWILRHLSDVTGEEPAETAVR